MHPSKIKASACVNSVAMEKRISKNLNFERKISNECNVSISTDRWRGVLSGFEKNLKTVLKLQLHGMSIPW